jgi:hypothetical protein
VKLSVGSFILTPLMGQGHQQHHVLQHTAAAMEWMIDDRGMI